MPDKVCTDLFKNPSRPPWDAKPRRVCPLAGKVKEVTEDGTRLEDAYCPVVRRYGRFLVVNEGL